MCRKAVLLVENDYLNRRLIKKILVENGYEVFEAKNAKIAMQTLNGQEIDLAILDINLGEGEMDGIDLGQEIHNSFQIPFIYLSAYENKYFHIRANAISPSSYLSKPFKNSDLIEAVKQSLV